MTRFSKRSLRGLSLVEGLVAMTLLALLLGLTHLAMNSGVKHFLNLRHSVELQQDALALLARLAREVAESPRASVWPEFTPNSAQEYQDDMPKGLVFLSPRDENGLLHLDPSSRRPIWQKRICYWYDPTENRIFRGTEPLDQPTDVPPPRDDEKNTAYFREQVLCAPLPGRVTELQIEYLAGSVQFQLQVSQEERGYVKRLEFVTSSAPKDL